MTYFPASALRTDTTQGDPQVVAKLYAPYTEWPAIVPNFLRLPQFYEIDREAALHHALDLQKRYGFEQIYVSGKKRKFTYRGLALTARPDTEDPLYDALNVYSDKETQLDINEIIGSTSERVEDRKLHPIRERCFSEFTEACTPFFQNILSRFRSPLLKVRLLELKPGGVLTSHIDFPYYEGIRIHCVLSTNEGCWWEVNGERRQLPADGRFYWMDVGKYHSVWNFGTTPRIVLSVNLSPYKNRDGTLRHSPEMSLLDLMTMNHL